MRTIKHPKNKENFEFYIKGLTTGNFTLRQVASITGYSTRQLTNIKKRYSKQGAKAFENKHKGMKPKKRNDLSIIAVQKRRHIQFSVLAQYLRYIR